MLMLLAVTYLMAIQASAITHSEHTHSDKRTERNERYAFLGEYEEVIPLQLSNGRTKRDLKTKNDRHSLLHREQVSFIVPTKNKEFTLDLQLNSGVISKTFSEYEVDGTGRRHQTRIQPEHCYYHGTIRGEHTSSVVIHTCQGLRGFFQVDDNMYNIEPHQGVPYHPRGMMHVVYKSNDVVNKGKMTCGTNHTLPSNNQLDAPHKIHNRMKRAIPTYNQLLDTRYIELYLVHDYRTYTTHNSETTLRTRSLSIANTIDAIYKNMNIRLVLVGVEYWSANDKSTVTTNYEDTLKEFCKYKTTYLPIATIDYDVAHLIVGLDLTGSVAGLAWVGTMCGEDSCGISEDSPNEQTTAFVMAHEIGHNLGMNHDDGRPTCNDCSYSGGCIMNSVLTSGTDPKALTSCSISDLSRFPFACLKDQPSSSYADPSCGNGILEKGEQCDCGTQQECPTVDPCCEVTGCKLKNSSQCAEGPCCSSCQFKASGTECRSEANDCDIKESCTGTSSQCTQDYYKEDGTACASNTAYCYAGLCKTRTDQCKYLLDRNDSTVITDAVDECYQKVNKRGDDFGNCGKTGSTYSVCADSNVFCGKLQCSGGNETEIIVPVIGTTKTGSIITYTLTNNSGIFNTYCKAGDANLGDDVPNPGLVSDGTKCGDQAICYKQECKTLTQLSLGGKCGKVDGVMCAGRGFCNQNSDCVCSGNYDPGTYCENVVDASTLLTCYSCADDQTCSNSSLLEATEKCTSNVMSCQTVKLDRGQAAIAEYYTRGCVYTSKCSALCQTTQHGYNLCTECCTTDLCNGGTLNGTSQSGGQTLHSHPLRDIVVVTFLATIAKTIFYLLEQC